MTREAASCVSKSSINFISRSTLATILRCSESEQIGKGTLRILLGEVCLTFMAVHVLANSFLKNAELKNQKTNSGAIDCE
ncbi:MAG: hypothetical protein JWL90_3670 [Chthoniobacteraceae bacterium]|nr:hypothetical protein [Chthoniobacteraceae bacterium]